jgi:hypothetical protein
MWVLGLVVFAVAGCNEVTTPAPSTTAPYTLAVSSSPAPGDPGPPLEGAELCETDTANCALSDARGRVTIQLPIGEQTSYTLEKERHASYLVPLVMPAEGVVFAFTMPTDEHMVAQFKRVMSPYPMIGTGMVGVALEPRFAGAAFELAYATGKAFYNDEEGRRSLDLTETTSFGYGGFVEVPPGEFQINLGGTAQQCDLGSRWPGDVENSVAFPIRENYVTGLTVNCLPP